MQAQNQTQQCTNCHQPFPIDRIDLHEAYCCRNIRKCNHCEKWIDIKDQEQHNKEFHDKKQCPMCNQRFQPSQFAAHQQICPRKPKNCKYCENSWPQSQYNKHVESCGARTKPCLVCHKNIMLKDLEEHTRRCVRRQERVEVSQDRMRQRANGRGDRMNGGRERQSSTNHLRQPIISSSNKIIRPNNFKPTNIISPEVIKPIIDPIPISIRLAMLNKPTHQAKGSSKTKN